MNRKILIGAGVAVAVAFSAAYVASPLLAFNSLKSALKSGDRDKLEQMVDFPAVRDSLKAQLKVQMMASLQNDPEMQDNPFAGLAMVMAPAIIDQAVEGFVTPEAISAVVETGDPRRGGAAPAKDAKGEASKGPQPKLAYKDLNTFTASVPVEPPATGETVMVMKRQGLFGWKLKRIDLPKNLMQPAGQG